MAASHYFGGDGCGSGYGEERVMSERDGVADIYMDLSCLSRD